MKTNPDNAWMTAVQRDIPLVRRPFAVIGSRFDMTEDAVLTKIKTLFDEGKARRIGGVFDVRGVGYRSALCAATVPDAELERTAALLTPEAGMTHCYQRGWPEALGSDLPEAPPAGIPNLWFTLSAQGDAFDVKVAALRETLAPAPFFVMPAVRHFKIDVVFDVGGSERSSEVSTPAAVEHSDAPPAVFSESDRALIRAMQGLIPLTPAPYDEIAVTLGLDPDAVLDRLRAWKAAGILRRVGIILRHRKLGFSANGMCVWRAMPDSIENAGKTLATFRDVTHCYEREVIPGFPYNLFAMIHAGTYEEALVKFHKLSDAAGLDDGRVLFSMREFKKTSPRYFCEDL
jgi:DNA-binding Lrp family transcriptional regulator